MFLENFIPPKAKSFFAYKCFQQAQKTTLLLSSSEDEAIILYKQLKFFAPQNLYYLPSFDASPYDSASPSQDIISARIETLVDISLNKGQALLIVTAATNLLGLLPLNSVFNDILTIKISAKVSIDQLTNYLLCSGFVRNSSAAAVGQFARRGEIIDLVLFGNRAYRINFQWDIVKSIKSLDLTSQISENKTIDSLTIYPVSQIILNEESIQNFKNNFLKAFGINKTNSLLYQNVINGKEAGNVQHLGCLFYEEKTDLIKYLDSPTIIYDQLALQSIASHEVDIIDLYQNRLNINKLNAEIFYPAFDPSLLFISSKDLIKTLHAENNILLDNPSTAWSFVVGANPNMINSGDYNNFINYLKESKKKTIIICCASTQSFKQISLILDNHSYLYKPIDHLAEASVNSINLTKLYLAKGFAGQNLILIADSEIFGKNYAADTKISSSKRLKNLLTNLSDIEVNELVVHKEHGIGRFLGLELITAGGAQHDCLKILYADDNKLYVPTQNIGLIKKYGSDATELDRLGSLNWQRRIAKSKERLNDIASSLMAMAAKRRLSKNCHVDFDLTAYDQFCADFVHTETQDQLKAIADVRQDLCSGQIMDRLICGDVGFGKTEVAVRAAYIVASNIAQAKLPQIAIIVPTTVLCRQHYFRFSERFKGTSIKITELSRLVPESKAKKIKQALKNNDSDISIIIGTHALLSKKIEFNNLQLIIIDEEQHFGVGQKEYLKQIKANVHVLSLSATPIPRTMQMSLLGLKDLSIIASPPEDRLTINTIIISFDEVTIRDALLKEKFRNGKSFFVCPRIKDINEIESKLKQIVPELSFGIAHGQMPANMIDRVMSDFYNSKFDCLISTTIIESGLDISSANTMFIYKPDILGLSQLYQLRGRIGRSKVRAYAYLVLAKNKKITKESIKRLEILQNINSLGAGFTIASHDMDLRGFGNLIGSEQAGNVKEVGLELYQEMLEQSIADLKNEKSEIEEQYVPVINIGIASFIPENYITDCNLKLNIYRRIANLKTNEEIEVFKIEILNRFGDLPIELLNLLEIVKIKILAYLLHIESINKGERGFIIHFHESASLIANKIMQFIQNNSGKAKLKDNNKMIILSDLSRIENIVPNLMTILDELQIS